MIGVGCIGCSSVCMAYRWHYRTQSLSDLCHIHFTEQRSTSSLTQTFLLDFIRAAYLLLPTALVCSPINQQNQSILLCTVHRQQPRLVDVTTSTDDMEPTYNLEPENNRPFYVKQLALRCHENRHDHHHSHHRWSQTTVSDAKRDAYLLCRSLCVTQQAGDYY